MGKIGRLMTSEPIDKAMRIIREWLEHLKVNGLDLNLNYDAKQNIALAKFKYNNKSYEFRSTAQANCRLNMWAIARVMEYKVRSHLMGIETFDKSMIAYLALEAPIGYVPIGEQPKAENQAYFTLGVSPLASNEELEKAYKNMAKNWHPDRTSSEGAKPYFEKMFREINEAWEQIKRERGL